MEAIVDGEEKANGPAEMETRRRFGCGASCGASCWGGDDDSGELKAAKGLLWVIISRRRAAGEMGGGRGDLYDAVI